MEFIEISPVMHACARSGYSDWRYGHIGMFYVLRLTQSRRIEQRDGCDKITLTNIGCFNCGDERGITGIGRTGL